MTESLAWERFSTFSHNRHLEEVEKISKTGSVAQKRAYFEAHYKRVAAAKKAAALLEEQNVAADKILPPDIVDQIHSTSCMDSESSNANNNMAMDELPDKEAPNTELLIPVDENVCNPKVEIYELDNGNVEEAEQVIEESVLLKNTYEVEISNQLETVEDQEMILAPKEKTPIKESVHKDILASTSKKKPTNFSLKSFTSSKASRLPSSAKLSSPVQPRKETNAIPNNKKSTKGLVDKKRSTPNSLHRSINFSSHAKETSGRFFPSIQKVGSSQILTTSIRKSKDSSAPPRPPFVGSVVQESNNKSVTPMSEDGRAKILVTDSSAGRTVDGKGHATFLDRPKSSSSCGRRAQSPTMCSSFNFRTEERAAKRKEFFQKLEEKSKAKAENGNSQIKEKTETIIKKLRQSIGLKSKPTGDACHETELSSNHMKKVVPTRFQSPKLERKPSPSTVQDTSSRPPRRPSHKIDGSKFITEKTNQIPIRPVTPLQKKNARENASPNIQVRVSRQGDFK